MCVVLVLFSVVCSVFGLLGDWCGAAFVLLLGEVVVLPGTVCNIVLCCHVFHQCCFDAVSCMSICFTALIVCTVTSPTACSVPPPGLLCIVVLHFRMI